MSICTYYYVDYACTYFIGTSAATQRLGTGLSEKHFGPCCGRGLLSNQDVYVRVCVYACTSACRRLGGEIAVERRGPNREIEFRVRARAVRAGEAKLRGRARGIDAGVARGPATQMFHPPALSLGGAGCPAGCSPCPDRLSRRLPSLSRSRGLVGC